MNVKIQKKLLNFLTLKYIFDYNRTLKRAETLFSKPKHFIRILIINLERQNLDLRQSSILQ